MKSVHDIIWSDLFNDDTVITIYDIKGDRLSFNSFRLERKINKWDNYYACEVDYYPNINSLYITLALIGMKGGTT